MNPEINFLLFRHASEPISLADGETLFEQGDTGDEMFAVKSGRIRIVQAGQLLETLEPGEIFGELVLIADGERAAAAVAEGATEVIPINRKRFRFLVQANPDFSIEVMKILVERLRRQDGHNHV